MVPDQTLKEMLDIFKSSTQATWRTITLLQDQTAHMASVLYDQSAALQDQSREAFEQWMDEVKTSQAKLKKAYFAGINSIIEVVTPVTGWEFEFDPDMDV